MKSERPATPAAPAIEVRDLHKRFRLYRRPLDRLLELLPGVAPRHREFWALKGVSFSVGAGEVFGILGPNGAGKSTLLRLLAGTSRSTRGGAQVHGRASSLLELGAGFHADFTGRQNLLLTARLMGVPQDEARQKLAEMIAFAEIDEFIDQPVRTYSTGMIVRLGFAVASGFDPDILILDEALSVGDAYFQRKSLQRIVDFRDAGKTILMVTHDLRLVGRFCHRALWLEEGEARALGPAADVVRAYESSTRRREEERLAHAARRSAAAVPGAVPAAAAASAGDSPGSGARWGRGPIRITGVEMVGESQRPGWVFRLREQVELRLHAVFLERVEAPVVSFQIHRLDAVYVSGTSTADNNVDHFPLGPQEGAVTLVYRFAPLHLHAGTYTLSAQAFARADEPFWSDPSDFHFQAYEFRILSPYAPHGVVALPGVWEIRPGAVQASLPRQVRPGEPDAAAYLYGEWHLPEGDGDQAFRWTGAEAGLLLRREPGDAHLQLHLALPRDTGEALSVDIEVEGRPAGQVQVAPGGVAVTSINVPASAAAGTVRVMLRPRTTWSPRDEGLGDDPRRLGVAVMQIGWDDEVRAGEGLRAR